MSDLTRLDISMEAWREYDFGGRVYRVVDPDLMYVRPGGTTHRILDKKGVVHCLPAPGFHGCVLRWKSKDGYQPVAF